MVKALILGWKQSNLFSNLPIPKRCVNIEHTTKDPFEPVTRGVFGMRKQANCFLYKTNIE